MTDDKNASINRLAWAVLLGGVAVSHIASGYLYYPLSIRSWTEWLGSSAVLVFGLIMTSWVYWHLSRPFAGANHRVEVLAVLAFSAVVYRDWRRLAGLEGWSITIADFATSLAGFGLALLVYKCLAPIDRREADSNAAAAK